MKPFRAILFGVILWILIFIEIIILIFGFNYQAIPKPGGFYYLVHFTFLIIFSLLCSLSYFWVKDMNGGLIHGFILGIIFVILLVILDTLITIPTFTLNYKFLIRPDIIIQYLVVLICATLIGLSRK